MDFELPEEIALLKENVRRFVDRELIPVERHGKDGHRGTKEFLDPLREKSKALGLWLFDVPEEFGGQGFGMLARVVVWEELSRSTALPSRQPYIFGPEVSPILYQLNGEMREKYLMGVLRGERRSCFMQTEPDAGSDPRMMRTAATRDGNHYVINGSKRFITGAEKADFAQVFAKTTGDDGKTQISAFIVDMDTPGLRLGSAADLMIDDKPWEVFFDNVRVPAENLIGGEGIGFTEAQKWLNAGRIRHGSRSAGVMQRCLELATAYAKQRKTFGEPLANRQTVQNMLVDMHIDLHQLRLMNYHAAWKYDRGEDCRAEAFMCKTFGDERSFNAADRAMQIHGGMGMARDLPIECFWRDQRSMMITEGANEVLRMALSRMVLDAYGAA